MNVPDSIKRRIRIAQSALTNAWPFWLFCAGLLASWLAAVSLAAPAADQARIFGLALQELGLLLVAIGLSKIRRLFGIDSVPSRIIKWFRLLWAIVVLPEHPAITAKVSGVATIGASGLVSVGVAPNATLEERVEYLEKALTQLREHTAEDFEQVRKEFHGTAEDFRKALDDFRKSLMATDGRLTNLATGDFTVQLVGLMWLLLGAFFSTVPIR